jgi:hypothetical protein
VTPEVVKGLSTLVRRDLNALVGALIQLERHASHLRYSCSEYSGEAYQDEAINDTKRKVFEAWKDVREELDRG